MKKNAARSCDVVMGYEVEFGVETKTPIGPSVDRLVPTPS